MVEFQISLKITVGADSRVYEGSEAELQAFSRVELTCDASQLMKLQ
jgi:hypothetical protein